METVGVWVAYVSHLTCIMLSVYGGGMEVLIHRIDIHQHGRDEPIYSIELPKPIPEGSRRLEKIINGLSINMRDDCYIVCT